MSGVAVGAEMLEYGEALGPIVYAAGDAPLVRDGAIRPEEGGAIAPGLGAELTFARAAPIGIGAAIVPRGTARPRLGTPGARSGVSLTEITDGRAGAPRRAN